METVKAGDCVELLGQSTPKMTVESIKNGKASCVWIHEGDKKEGVFAFDALTPCKARKPIKPSRIRH